MLKEFKDFISKGSVLDMAVGLILATYFGAIIKSLVGDLLMPIIGNAIGGVDFTKLKYILKEAKDAVTDVDGVTILEEATAEVAFKWGAFVNHVITFIIVAFCIFLIVKAYNKSKKKAEEAPAAPPKPSKEEVLLGEIRDLLKK